jgi:hypothetical protein
VLSPQQSADLGKKIDALLNRALLASDAGLRLSMNLSKSIRTGWE